MRLWGDFLSETMGPVVPPDQAPADVSGLTDALNQMFSNKTA